MSYIAAAWAKINKNVKSNSVPRISDNIRKASESIYNLTVSLGDPLDVHKNILEKFKSAPDFEDMCIKLMDCMSAAFAVTSSTDTLSITDQMVARFASTTLGDYKAFRKFVLIYLKARIKAEIIRKFCLDKFNTDILDQSKARELFSSAEKFEACVNFCTENSVSNPELTINNFNESKAITEFGVYFLSCYGRQGRYAAIMMTVTDEETNIIGSSSENHRLWEKIKDYSYEHFDCDDPKALLPRQREGLLKYVKTINNFHRYTISELESFIYFHGVSVDTEKFDGGTTNISEIDDTEIIMQAISKMKDNSAFRPDDFEVFTVYIVHYYFKSGWDYDTLIMKLVWLSNEQRVTMLDTINACTDENITVLRFGKLLGVDMTSYSNAIARIRKKLCDIKVLLK